MAPPGPGGRRTHACMRMHDACTSASWQQTADWAAAAPAAAAAGRLRLVALAVQSLLRQAATADAPLPLESLGEHSPRPCDLPISQKSGHTLQVAPLPPTPANTRSRAWPGQARSASSRTHVHSQSAARHRRKQPAGHVPCFMRALFCSVHGNVTVSSCVRNICLFSFRKI